MSSRPVVTGLQTGDRVVIVADEIRATATYVGYAGGPTAMVILDGTEARVLVPRGWIERESKPADSAS